MEYLDQLLKVANDSKLSPSKKIELLEYFLEYITMRTNVVYSKKFSLPQFVTAYVALFIAFIALVAPTLEKIGVNIVYVILVIGFFMLCTVCRLWYEIGNTEKELVTLNEYYSKGFKQIRALNK